MDLLCQGQILEARAGIEPAHRAFAELGLTTWLPRRPPKSRGPCSKKKPRASAEMRLPDTLPLRYFSLLLDGFRGNHKRFPEPRQRSVGAIPIIVAQERRHDSDARSLIVGRFHADETAAERFPGGEVRDQPFCCRIELVFDHDQETLRPPGGSEQSWQQVSTVAPRNGYPQGPLFPAKVTPVIPPGDRQIGPRGALRAADKSTKRATKSLSRKIRTTFSRQTRPSRHRSCRSG